MPRFKSLATCGFQLELLELSSGLITLVTGSLLTRPLRSDTLNAQ